MSNTILVDKYRPQNLDDIVLDSDTKEYFRNLVKSGKMINCTFQGICGCGKSSLAMLLAKELKAHTLFVRCAIEGTIDVIRNKIQPFCETCSDSLKIVILDEVDAASKNGDSNFQSSLRNLIESSQGDTRFILTCNNKTVLPAVLSRCPIIPLGFSTRDLLLRIKYILDNEKISYTKESLGDFLRESIKKIPDIRSILGFLEVCISSGELRVRKNFVSETDKDIFLKEIIDKVASERNILKVREFYIQNKTKVSDYVTFASDTMNYLMDNGLVDDPSVILELTEAVYELNLVIDKEIGYFKLLTILKKHGIKQAKA